MYSFIGVHGDVIQTPWGQCIVDAGGYIFNTEAHPIDPGALYCCQQPHNLFPQKKSKIHKFVAVNDRRSEHTADIKLFEDDIDLREENNRTIKITKLSDIKKSEISDVTNTLKLINSTEANTISIQKQENVLETNGSVDKNYKVRIVAPPSAIYKADDSENVETLVTSTKTREEFPSSNDNTVNKNESVKYKEAASERKIYFDPQMMLEKIRKNDLYPSNVTAKKDFQLLSCHSQPFLQRLSIIGEIF
jgi:mannosidase alpha-like ER degradation enhancer 2